MEVSVKSSEPARRRHRRRALRYLAVLLAGCVGAYLVWDVLFMPADLRRLQGNWKAVRAVMDGSEIAPPIDRLVIAGRNVEFISGAARNPCSFDIRIDRRELSVYEQHETRIFGISVRLPTWLKRPTEIEILHYELSDNLVLRPPEDDPTQAQVFLEKIE